MSVLLNEPRIALQSQHSLQCQDLQLLCALINRRGLTEDLEDWTLEQFLGLALHLLLTSESSKTQQALVQLLPKFGSNAVYPLVRIVQSSQVAEELQTLALSILVSFEPCSLAIGLLPILQAENARDLRPAVLQTLALVGTPILQTLQILLTTEEWQLLGLDVLTQQSIGNEILGLPVNRQKMLNHSNRTAPSVAVA